MSVSVRRQHLKHSVVNSQQSYVECSTTEIKHQDVLLALFLVQAISDSCSRPNNMQPQ